MALWGVNDAEGSKPNWLTEEQKRNCFRTVRGWEIPLTGFGLTGSPTASPYYNRSGQYVGPTELLVAITVTGTGAPNYTNRGTTSVYEATPTADVPQYNVYFTTPLTGQALTASSGVTAYIPMIAVGCNLTLTPENLVFSITGTTHAPSGNTGNISLWQGATLSNTTYLSSAFYNQSTTLTGPYATNYFNAATVSSQTLNRYGGWGGLTGGAAALLIRSTCPVGTYGLTANVTGPSGQTGQIKFTVQVI